MGEPWDKIGQLVAPFETLGVLCEVASRVACVKGVIGPVNRPLDVPSSVFTDVRPANSQPPLPQSSPSTSRKHLSPSERTTVPGCRCRYAQDTSSCRRKPCTGFRPSCSGRPSSLTCTGATDGVLPQTASPPS